MEVVYEDNHLIVVNKLPGEIVQGDQSGDEPLVETLRRWLKEKYAKPGDAFCGVVHRIDRPVGGLVVFAKTSKALERLNEMFRQGNVHKTYWAITRVLPPAPQGELVHYIAPDPRSSNRSLALTRPRPGAKEARLRYRLLGSSEHYHLLEVELLTGRKHQIRAQLAAIGCPIRGDLKYGDRRSNPDGSISLQAHHIEFEHPVSHKKISLTAPVPVDPLWQAMEEITLSQTQQNG